MSTEKWTAPVDRLSDANVTFKHYLPSLCSPIAAMAGPWENIVDRDMDASQFFVSTPASCSNMLFSQQAKFVSPVSLCIRGAYPTLANP